MDLSHLSRVYSARVWSNSSATLGTGPCVTIFLRIHMIRSTTCRETHREGIGLASYSYLRLRALSQESHIDKFLVVLNCSKLVTCPRLSFPKIFSILEIKYRVELDFRLHDLQFALEPAAADHIVQCSTSCIQSVYDNPLMIVLVGCGLPHTALPDFDIHV